MANRHLSRSVILQTLFEWDFKGRPEQEAGDMLARNSEDYAPGLDDLPFMEAILENVVRKKEVIDEIIQKAAPEWPLEKINIVDRNILRLGLSELLFGNHEEVPPKVVINEAIELAKTFGGESSSKFINGVLGAVYREMGEPGKDQVSKKKAPKDMTPVDPATLPKEVKAGAVVYSITDGVIHLGLVHDVFGYWTLSRGGLEEGETPRDAAIREIKEEMNLTILTEEEIGSIDYVANHPVNGKTVKQIVYFLGRTEHTPITLESTGGLDDAKWFTLEEIPKLKMYDNIADIITKAITVLIQKYHAN
jgi:N utilization substance protein B